MKSSQNNVKPKRVYFNKVRKCFIDSLENYFYWHGKIVSQRPKTFIILSLVLSSLCALGFFNFRIENRPFKLWIPQESYFVDVLNWQRENFPIKLRPQFVIFEGFNVLEKESLLEMMKVHDIVAETSVEGLKFDDICTKVPKLADVLVGRYKRSDRQKRDLNWWFSMFKKDYCDLIDSIETACLEKTILEIWGYDRTVLEMKSQQEIYDDVNSVERSAIYGTPFNASNYLGGIKLDASNRIISARAARHLWATHVNYNDINNGSYLHDVGTGMAVDKIGYDWEQKFLDNVLNYSSTVKNVRVFVMAMSSFGKVTDTAVFGDVVYLGAGFCVVYFYVLFMLGKFNCIEQRPILTFIGISCVGLSILVSFGFCSGLGIPFGPVNTMLPFLLLGLGIDDMFVIMQSWNTLSPDEKMKSLSTRMGLTLRHAGVSITITSVTDFIAFAIGCTTVLPALRSFCLYAAFGIIAVYLLQTTFFTAWFTIDQRRLEKKRNCLFWCIKMDDWKVNECSQRDFFKIFFEKFLAKMLLLKFVKGVVIVFTLAFFGVCIWGVSNLRQEFNELWFLPESTYLHKYHAKIEQYFPAKGYAGVIYFSDMNLFKEMPKIFSLVDQLEQNKFISEVDSWVNSYQDYLRNMGYEVFDKGVDEYQFRKELGDFLFSPRGSVYRDKNFIFDGNASCLEPIPDVSATSIEFRHKLIHKSRDKLAAVDEVRGLIEAMNFTGYVKPWARIYGSWETDKIIEVELYRNLGLAMAVVFLLTFAFLTSITTSFMVVTCVVFTMVDVGAIMHWWGLTIDTVSCIYLVLAVGLCVDYAAHIGHSFMIQRGTREERMQAALTKIGPAVINGGFSTFLAFVFLIFSDSHAFKAFFKIFFSVSVLGLYHGLVFLPVLLSIAGPDPYEETPNTSELPESKCLQNHTNGSVVEENSVCRKLDSLNYETSL